MAKAMSGLGEWKPDALRVMRRILVFIDSMSPLDRRVRREAAMRSRCRAIRLATLTNGSSRHRRAHEIHPSRSSRAAASGSRKTCRSCSLSR